jgi:hypothetical protein
MMENEAEIPFLEVGPNTVKNPEKSTKQTNQPPDGGFWASVVMQRKIQNKFISSGLVCNG